jgi:hypothetical protein
MCIRRTHHPLPSEEAALEGLVKDRIALVSSVASVSWPFRTAESWRTCVNWSASLIYRMSDRTHMVRCLILVLVISGVNIVADVAHGPIICL